MSITARLARLGVAVAITGASVVGYAGAAGADPDPERVPYCRDSNCGGANHNDVENPWSSGDFPDFPRNPKPVPQPEGGPIIPGACDVRERCPDFD